MKEKLIEALEQSFEKQYEKRGLLTAPHTADYLLANGVIVLPCKVGDMVYALRAIYGYGGLVYYREISEETAEMFCLDTDEDSYLLEQFGKTVFLTRKEAEVALKEDEG